MRDFLNSEKGRLLGLSLAIVGILAVAWVLVGRMSSGPAAAAAGRVFIDSETGKSFRHTLTVGQQTPIESPETGRRTAYEAEPCYWTADGATKPEPTWVLPKDRVDAAAGPTFCPDCRRLVTQLNPMPGPGARPPPTQPEYEERQAARSPGRSGNGVRPQPDQPPAGDEASQSDPRTAGDGAANN